MAKGTRGGSNDVTLDLVSTDELTSGTFNGMKAQVAKLGVGALGAMEQVDASNPLPVVQTGASGLPTGASTAANQTTVITDLGGVTETAPATDTASSGLNGRLQRIAQRLTSLIAVFSIGAGTEAAAVRVTLPTDGTGKVAAAQSGAWTVTQTLPTTGTTSQVNDTASSTTLLSSDATRKGFRIWNDSTSILYVKYGTTASATDCSVQMAPGSYLEENFYSGRVDGIWSVDASGAARITSLT